MHRIQHNGTRLEIIKHLEHVNSEYPTSCEEVLFIFPSFPMMNYLADRTVDFKMFGTPEGISKQIDSFIGPVGLVYFFVGYHEPTDSYIIGSSPIKVSE